MNNKIYNIIKNLFKIILICLGLSIFIWFIWIRFIRERLPRNIPFQLNEIGFYILLWICFTYFYIIYKLIRPKEPKAWILEAIEIMYVPLTALDETIKTQKYIYPKFLTNVKSYSNYFNDLSLNHYKIIYFCYNLLPRIFLIVVLIVDIFIFKRIFLFYSFVLINLFPLIHRYVKYSLKHANKYFSIHLENKYKRVQLYDECDTDLDWKYDSTTMLYHNKNFTIEEYLDLQVKLFREYLQNEIVIEYKVSVYSPENIYEMYIINKHIITDKIPELTEEDYKKYIINKYLIGELKLTKEDYEIIDKDFYTLAPVIKDLRIIISTYSIVENIIWIKYFRVFIFSIYFVCWAYILYVSYDNVQLFPFTWLTIEYTFDFILPSIFSVITLLIKEYNEKIEPISGLWL